MNETINFSIIKNFGPSIVKIKIPEKIINTLNSHVDEVISSEKKLKNLNFGNSLAGDVSQEFKLEQDLIIKSGWGNFLSLCVTKWIEIEIKKKITKFEIQKSWIVRQFQNEYNPTHTHNGHISGAGFLKVPSYLGKHVQNKDLPYYGGKLQLIHGARMFLSQSTYTILPEVGDFYFFPNYMMHTVFPFKDTNEERRSISFNAFIDDDIYNVFK